MGLCWSARIYDYPSVLSLEQSVFFFLHSLKLSILLYCQLVIYLLCFDLSATLPDQIEQVLYWLKFLQSSIPRLYSGNNVDKNWSVIVVGLKNDAKKETFSADSIRSWQPMVPDLPLYDRLFEVSSLQAQESVRDLLDTITNVCTQIFDKHTVLIPNSYRKLLKSIKSLPADSFDLSSSSPYDQHSLIHFNRLHSLTKDECDMDLQSFEHALHYYHAIGQIVFLQNGFVCPRPHIIPKLLAKFVSPAEVQRLLLAQNSAVQILTQ